MKQLTRVAIGLGSNLGDRAAFIRSAFVRLQEDLFSDARLSSLYESAPWGGIADGPFLNAVAVGDTDWKPPAILNLLKQIERDLGRTPAPRYGNREIDLDILIYGEMRWKADGLEVPHPRMEERSFVIFPLAEVWPDWKHPDAGRTARQLKAEWVGEVPVLT